jgi:hypothetical protein
MIAALAKLNSLSSYSDIPAGFFGLLAVDHKQITAGLQMET